MINKLPKRRTKSLGFVLVPETATAEKFTTVKGIAGMTNSDHHTRPRTDIKKKQLLTKDITIEAARLCSFETYQIVTILQMPAYRPVGTNCSTAD